jgi:23S rRNA pseudouridine1911/1915/1917 synthase
MTVLYEDNHLIIVNKACGEIVQADKTGDPSLEETVKQWLKDKYHKSGNVFLGVTHRLDRPVSGIVLLAKTGKALVRLNEQFQKGEIKKTYLAVVKSKPDPPSGFLEQYIFRDEAKNRSYVCGPNQPGAKKALLSYRLAGQSHSFYLVEVQLMTGRHHQIRCQLASIGCPIRGDLKYGYPRSNPDAGISLHAWQVQFMHPVTKKWITVQAPFPPQDPVWTYF